MLQLVLGLLGAALGLGGAFIYQYIKAKSAEALLTNVDTKNKVNQLNGQIDNNNAQINQEQRNRDQIEKDAKAKENQNVSKDELLDFLNKKSNK